MAKTVLTGITWEHSRGITPLLAYSQRFTELNPDVDIIWKKRTLQEFADSPIEKLSEHYDLLIIDHPWVGCAATTKCVLPLEEHISKEYLEDQLQNSIGYSHLSYYYNGHQWALAIDAAAPAASIRTDLFEKNSFAVPSTWDDVIMLAKMGKVAAPGVAIDLLMCFYMFCIAHGKEPFSNEEEVIDKETAVRALQSMRQLYSIIDKRMFHCNPIAVAELMTQTDDYWYCPFAYCYSNYSRNGYAKNVLLYAAPVHFNSVRLRSTIGGTGLAVSAFSKNAAVAVEFAKQIVSVECQSSFYMEHGGQPGHKAAWVSENANRLCNNFFRNVLPVMEIGYVRPRYNGYLYFQDRAGDFIRNYLMGEGSIQSVLNDINKLYKRSVAACYLEML